MNRAIRFGIPALLLLQTLFAAWALNLDRFVTEESPAAFTPIELPPTAAPIDVETGAPLAKHQADRWDSHARLIAVVMRLEWPDEIADQTEISLPVSGWIVYTYAAGDRTLSVYLDRRTGVYITSTETGYGDDVLPAIDLTEYERTSTTAALTAEVLLGSSFRTACPEWRSTVIVTPSRMMGPDGTEVPIWVVSYADERSGNAYDVVVRLNASDGNVIDSRTNDRSCGA